MRTKVPKMATDPVKSRAVSIIQDLEFRIDSELKVLKMAAVALREAKNKYHIAFFACRKKETPRNSERYELAVESLHSSENVFRTSEMRIDELVASIESAYNRLMTYTTPRVAAKLADELELYKFGVDEKKRRFCKGLSESDVSEELGEGDADASLREPAPAAPAAPGQPKDEPAVAKAQLARVNIAPAAIDISPHVEKAITATMDAFTRRMEKRIEEYFSTLVFPAAPEGAVTVGSDNPKEEGAADPADTPTLSQVSEMVSGLDALLSTLNSLVGEMERLTREGADIAEKQRQISHLQNELNDMQRVALRDQKGLMASQKVVAVDQREVAELQSTLSESQRISAEEARRIANVQSEIMTVQSTLAAEQSSLAEASAAIVGAQREIVRLQGNVSAANTKNMELNRTLSRLHSDLTAAQKQALSEERQLLREQRARDKKRLAVRSSDAE